MVTPLPISLTVNGEPITVTVETWVTLLDLLRNELGLTGAKRGCDRGQCGACTVLIDGQRHCSCLRLAVSAEGADIVTIEGVAQADGKLHPMQEAFIAHDAMQCGFCTPGQIMSAIALLAEGCSTTPEAVAAGMAGNLCRCAAYPNIVAAILSACRAKTAG
jgi:xanthine dehydrogenase YagT iron-sulfur-binding subunit